MNDKSSADSVFSRAAQRVDSRIEPRGKAEPVTLSVIAFLATLFVADTANTFWKIHKEKKQKKLTDNT